MKRSPALKPAFWVLVALVCGIGLLMIGVCGFAIYRANASEAWPKATGRVVLSQPRKDCGVGGGSSYSLKLQYDYEVQGNRFSGHQSTFGLPYCGSEKQTRDLSKHYFVGKEVRVSYHPANPDVAVLVTGQVEVNTYMVGLSGLFVLFVGGVLAFNAARARARSTPPALSR